MVGGEVEIVGPAEDPVYQVGVDAAAVSKIFQVGLVKAQEGF